MYPRMFTQQRPRVTDRSVTTDPFFDSDLFVTNDPRRAAADQDQDSFVNQIASRVSQLMRAEQGLGGVLQRSQIASGSVPIADNNTTTKFVHSSYEYLSGVHEGKTFEKEERISVNEAGARTHVVKRAIDGASSISTWTCPPGAPESSIAHIVSFSDNANRGAFEKTWHQQAPFELRDEDDEDDDEENDSAVKLLEKEKGSAGSGACGGGKGQASCPPTADLKKLQQQRM